MCRGWRTLCGYSRCRCCYGLLARSGSGYRRARREVATLTRATLAWLLARRAPLGRVFRALGGALLATLFAARRAGVTGFGFLLCAGRAFATC